MVTGEKTEHDTIQKSFKEAINMTAKDIEKWLKTDESQSVGFKHEGESESIGRQSAEKIIDILGKAKSDLDEEDYQHMHKVIGYVHRHLAQKPHKDIETSNWRYSLMNWGHDPLKD